MSVLMINARADGDTWGRQTRGGPMHAGMGRPIVQSGPLSSLQAPWTLHRARARPAIKFPAAERDPSGSAAPLTALALPASST